MRGDGACVAKGMRGRGVCVVGIRIYVRNTYQNFRNFDPCDVKNFYDKPKHGI